MLELLQEFSSRNSFKHCSLRFSEILRFLLKTVQGILPDTPLAMAPNNHHEIPPSIPSRISSKDVSISYSNDFFRKFIRDLPKPPTRVSSKKIRKIYSCFSVNASKNFLEDGFSNFSKQFFKYSIFNIQRFVYLFSNICSKTFSQISQKINFEKNQAFFHGFPHKFSNKS